MATKLNHRVNAPAEHDQYLFMHICDLWNLTANAQIGDRTPHEVLNGDTPDISHIRFKWWDQVWYYAPDSKYPSRRMLPGRFLGFAYQTGDELTFRVLTCPDVPQRQAVISRSVVTPRRANEPAHGAFSRKASDYYFPRSILSEHSEDFDQSARESSSSGSSSDDDGDSSHSNESSSGSSSTSDSSSSNSQDSSDSSRINSSRSSNSNTSGSNMSSSSDSVEDDDDQNGFMNQSDHGSRGGKRRRTGNESAESNLELMAQQPIPTYVGTGREQGSDSRGAQDGSPTLEANLQDDL